MTDSENTTADVGKFLLFAGRNDTPGQCWDAFLAAFDSPATAEFTAIHLCRHFGYDWWEIVSTKTFRRFKACHGERFEWFRDFEVPHEDLELRDDSRRVKRLIQAEVSRQHRDSADPELIKSVMHSHLNRLLHPVALAALMEEA